jgi:hypothetical protein
MHTAELHTADLASLRAPREFPAVSVIMPTLRADPGRQNPLRLRNMIEEASRRLSDANLPQDEAAGVIAALGHAAASAGLRHPAEALVLLAAPGGEYHSFVLPYVTATPRVVIGRSFATRDIVAARQHAWAYWVLALSEQPTRLWSGHGEQLAESGGGSFPMLYDDSLPDQRGPVPRAREAVKVKNDRREEFFRHVLAATASVMSADPRPLVVTGVRRYLAYFEQLAPVAVRERFIGPVEGSFDQATPSELAALVAPVLTAERERWQRAAISRLEEARSERLFAGGLYQVWDLASAGQVRELLAEEGYLAPARESGGHLLQPGSAGGDPVDDAVDTIMDAVLSSGGEVIFVPDGSLEDCDRIAASLRY